MIALYIKNHDYHYESENLIRLFFPEKKIEKIYAGDDLTDSELTGDFVFTRIDDRIYVRVHIGDFDQYMYTDKGEDNEIELACILYDLLFRYTDVIQPWGILTGVRPVKLYDNIQKEIGEAQAKDLFLNKYRVSLEKFNLLYDVYLAQKTVKDENRPDYFSLYISIPFCPSRCNYCSFISSSIEKTRHLIKDYVPLLIKEIRYTAQIAQKLDLKLISVYMGGGTPTTLCADDLKLLIDEVRQSFDMSYCREITVEAGRPDTITAEKLQALKESGVKRISINPQTFNDDVLRVIGRKHSVDDFLNAYDLARKTRFENINMDLIAGLESDTLESFINSVDRALALDPESITVHTLSLKSGSNLFMRGSSAGFDRAGTVRRMLDYSQGRLKNHGYHPYYLYRQSKMVGNLENTGYSRPGYESLYNIYVMEEIHTVLACGAGAVTRLKEYGCNNLERIFNFKYPFEYIDRFDEMLERKSRITEFYNNIDTEEKK